MKKVFSLILVAVMLLLSVAIPVSAEEVVGPLYKDKFYERYYHAVSTFYYEELYYHHVSEEDEESPIDWVLVHGIVEIWESWGFSSYLLIGDRVIVETAIPRPFEIPYAVYDVEKDEFIGIKDVDCNQYDGLIECVQELNLGLLVGDVDRDKTLTVLDATIIQRCIAQLEEFPEYDVCQKFGHSSVHATEQLAYYSDIDRDGERTILDATIIQKKVANIEA